VQKKNISLPVFNIVVCSSNFIQNDHRRQRYHVFRPIQ